MGPQKGTEKGWNGGCFWGFRQTQTAIDRNLCELCLGQVMGSRHMQGRVAMVGR